MPTKKPTEERVEPEEENKRREDWFGRVICVVKLSVANEEGASGARIANECFVSNSYSKNSVSAPLLMIVILNVLVA